MILLCAALCSCVWDSGVKERDYLPIDDTQYPYAQIPRVIIETENLRQITDTETRIPANLQIYGENAPESNILDLTVKGRGNSSFDGMPKYGIKLEFEKKQSLLGMPENKDWALIANFADKTLLKNHLSYKLYEKLGAKWSPKNELVEVYLNRNYMGVYMLVETIKVGKNRVDIKNDSLTYLAEIDKKSKPGDLIVHTDRLPYRIHYPKDSIDTHLFANHINEFEKFLQSDKSNDFNSITKYIDIESYLPFYWTYELGSTFDCFRSSTFFTWKAGETIKMGPVWDMDLAYGDPLHGASPTGWQVRNMEWNYYLFKNKSWKDSAKVFWQEHHQAFEDLRDSLPIYGKKIEAAAQNNFKRWPVLESTENWAHINKFKTYEEAVKHLQNWVSDRIAWIDKTL